MGSVDAMRERILAVVGAIGLIAGALFLRSIIAGPDASDDGPNGSNGGRSSSDAPVVACERDLQAVCDALVDEGTITAAPNLGLAGSVADDLTVDGWITWDPAPGVANFDRPDTWTGTEALASAPLGVLAEDAADSCSSVPTWGDCVLAAAEGGVPVGVGNGTTAQSLARLYPLAAALVPDQGDFRAVDGLALRNVIESTMIRQDDYARQISTLLTQRGALGLVVGPAPALEAAAARLGAAVFEPTPGAEITVVITTRQTASGARPITAESLLGAAALDSVFADLGLVAGNGTVADKVRAGEVHAIRDKVA